MKRLKQFNQKPGVTRREILREAGGLLGASLLNPSAFFNTLGRITKPNPDLVKALKQASQSVAAAWAEAINKIRFEDLAPEVVKRRKLRLLDDLGVMAHPAKLKDGRTYFEKSLAVGGAPEVKTTDDIFSLNFSIKTA